VSGQAAAASDLPTEIVAPQLAFLKGLRDVRFGPKSGHWRNNLRAGAKLTSTNWRGTIKSLRDGAIAMPLQRGEVQGYDFNRSVVEFTMLNEGKVIPCAISTAAMDDIEGKRNVRPDQRLDQFMRLREVIEQRASRKFFEEKANQPVVLRANDFSK
jgi:hypothetical protein